jgi:hypothetical protein
LAKKKPLKRRDEEVMRVFDGLMQIDLHGYHPADLNMTVLIEQAWQTGAAGVTLIHGHGRHRGHLVRANTNTGFFGVRIRRALRHDAALKPYIVRSSLDVSHQGSTYVRLRRNPTPSRTEIDMSLIGCRRYEP